MILVENKLYQIELNEGSNYFTYRRHDGLQNDFSLPVFEVNGESFAYRAEKIIDRSEKLLRNDTKEITIQTEMQNNFLLTMRFRVSPDNEVLKYQFDFSGPQGSILTKKQGDALEYLSFENYSDVTEIRFSEFNEFLHSFILTEYKVDSRLYGKNHSVMGPMILEENKNCKILVAYEHGSQYPDRYIEYVFGDKLSLRAVKGNYYNGQPIDQNPYESVWLQLAIFSSKEEPSAAYRTFQLKYASPNLESREPYIFYNTWCFQERNKAYNKQMYLTSMNEERMLAEIDVAYKMGIDVFVIDTGWFDMTGDWLVNKERFPHSFDRINAKLNEYGMKLGLWFNPKAAATISKVIKGYEDCIMTTNEKNNPEFAVWETPDSYDMCLVSKYWKSFADRLIALVKEIGVCYFKWDAVGQYGCDSPNHYHGTKENSIQERADCYAFNIGLYLSKIVDRVCEQCPEAIVDFDITEGDRYVGLGFLSSGKYFLINNGPYYPNYDIPESPHDWINIFVRPGAARTWVCRSPLTIDKWIPSVLFLTHYLPDDPASSQILNIASLILGQNGIWGDLLNISEQGIKLFGDQLALYKKVKYDITKAYPVTVGDTACGFEIHEKINAENGKGAVVIFGNDRGHMEYLTKNVVSSDNVIPENVTLQYQEDGTCLIAVDFLHKRSAVILYFGIQD